MRRCLTQEFRGRGEGKEGRAVRILYPYFSRKREGLRSISRKSWNGAHNPLGLGGNAGRASFRPTPQWADQYAQAIDQPHAFFRLRFDYGAIDATKCSCVLAAIQTPNVISMACTPFYTSPSMSASILSSVPAQSKSIHPSGAPAAARLNHIGDTRRFKELFIF